VSFYENTALISGAAIYGQLTTPFDHVLSDILRKMSQWMNGILVLYFAVM